MSGVGEFRRAVVAVTVSLLIAGAVCGLAVVVWTAVTGSSERCALVPRYLEAELVAVTGVPTRAAVPLRVCGRL